MGYSNLMNEGDSKLTTVSDRQRWDQRYRQGSYENRYWPSAYLERLCHDGTIGSAGRALEIACGRGRNSLYLAERGFQVDAVDVSPVALAYGVNSAISQGLAVNWQCRNVLEGDVSLEPAAQYDLIVVIRFVAPKLLPKLVAALSVDGVLLIDSHMRWSGSEDLVGPSGQRFRVKPGELKRLLRSAQTPFDIVDDYEGLVPEPATDGQDGVAAVSRLCIRRRTS